MKNILKIREIMILTVEKDSLYVRKGHHHIQTCAK